MAKKRVAAPKRPTPRRAPLPVQPPQPEPMNGKPASEPEPVTVPVPVPEAPPQTHPDCERADRITLLVEVKEEPIRYFHDPLIPAGCLTFVVGRKAAGKSTFGAWLCTNATRPLVLAGAEESVSAQLLPRLRAMGADLVNVGLLRDFRWQLPDHRDKLLERVREHRADLLWIDPIDNYVNVRTENDPDTVRAALEALVRIAHATGCAVVCARHPAKAKDNLMPGSRHWTNVPRVILELVRDDGPPRRRFIRCHEDSLNSDIRPRFFDLVGEKRKAPILKWGEFLDEAEAAAAAERDRLERTKIDEATELLRGLLSEGELESTFIYLRAEQERLGERTVRMAKDRLGVVVERRGNARDHKSYWRLPTPDSGTPAGTDGHTPSQQGVCP